MELKIKQPTFPEVIEFNFDELKQEIVNRVAMYSNLVYTEEQVKQAKADRANLNKFVKALSDERIKVKKQCLQPYEAFEAKVNELVRIVQEPIALIDEQVKGYEEKQKQEKLEKIKAFFEKCNFEDFKFEQIFDEKWLNASVSMKSIEEAICARGEQIAKDLSTLSNLPEFGFEATEVYKRSLDINTALNEGKRLSEMQKRKAEHEAEQARLAAEAEAKKQAECPVVEVETHVVECGVTGSIKAEVVKETPEKQWVSFRAHLTVDEARELKKFFDDRAILFEAI